MYARVGRRGLEAEIPTVQGGFEGGELHQIEEAGRILATSQARRSRFCIEEFIFYQEWTGLGTAGLGLAVP